MKDVFGRIEIVLGDITELKVDAIVNAANRALSGGGGVDGAIHRAAGPELVKASRQFAPCDTGKIAVTAGFNLSAQYVFHAVGPVWYGGMRDEAALLASCYLECFKAMTRLELKTIAFPAISTGAYGYPMQKATDIALTEASQFLEGNSSVESIIFACFDKKSRSAYIRQLSKTN